MMWVVVEVSVEDTARAIIARDHSVVRRLVDERIVPRKSAPVEGAEPDPHKIYRALETSAQTTLPKGRVAEQFCMILAHVGLQLDLSLETRDVLAEMNYVRNCLLHRSGIADERALRDAPALAPTPGERLVVSENRIQTYAAAASDFAVALLGAAVGSRYVSDKE